MKHLSGRNLVIALPMVWLLVFFLAPFFVLLNISFSEYARSMPPYTNLAEYRDGVLSFKLNFENYFFLIEDGLYISAYLNSIKISAVATFFTLLVGYPIAYAIARAPRGWQNILLMLIILPFWTSFLLRVYAWIGILKGKGLLNAALMKLGIIDSPMIILQTDWAVYIGIVYTYLPFMILPLYAALTRLSEDLLEAAADLGANPTLTFLTVTLPLSFPGIIAGSLLVFIPVIGEFVIPTLLGGPDTLMIGKVLWNEFFIARDWPVASAVAIALVIFVVLPTMWLRRLTMEKPV